MKRTFALVLGIVMLLSFFVGCADKNDSSEVKELSSGVDENLNTEGYPIVNEEITVSIMGSKASIQGAWDQLKFFTIMEDMTNIKFEFDTPMSDIYQEKKNLTFISGDYPDVFLGGVLTFQEEAKYGEAGILIPLEDLIEEYAPNITRMFNEMPDVKKSVTAPDGHIYALPQINKNYGADIGLWYNEEWMNALGVTEVPTTAEGTRDLLLRFKNEDPNGNGLKDEIPLSGAGKGVFLGDHFLPAFGIYDREFYVKDDKVQYGYTSENYPEFIKFVNSLWEDGLVDQEIFTQGQSAMIAKSKSNQVGLVEVSVPHLAYDVLDLEKAAEYQPMPALSSSISSERAIRGGSGIGRGTFAITTSCENPEAMMRWADYLYTEEGSMLVHFGEENDLFKYLDDGRKQYIPVADGRSSEEYRGGVITPDCGTAMPKWVREENEAKWDDPFQEVRLAQIKSQLPFAHIPLPDMYLTPDEQTVVDTRITDLEKYVESMEAKFYVGEESLDNYDEFVETIEQIGVNEILEAYQAAYDRWNNS